MSDASWIVGDDPHPVDENPLDHVGEEMPDPWHDENQKDWPNEKVEVED